MDYFTKGFLYKLAELSYSEDTDPKITMPHTRYNASDAGKAVGHVVLRKPEADRDGKYGFLRELYVKPEARGKGYARALVEYAKQKARGKSLVFKPHPFADKPLDKKELTEFYKHLGAVKYPNKRDRMMFPAEAGLNRDAILAQLGKVPGIGVGGGAAMVLHGLRDNTRDIDAEAPTDRFEAEWLAAGKPTIGKATSGTRVFKVPSTDIDLHEGMAGEYSDIDGVPAKVQTRAALLDFYKQLNRPKDQEWIKKLSDEEKTAAITLDIEKGDTLLGGRFKNMKTVVKDIGTDELGQPTINGKKLLSFRILKNMPTQKSAALVDKLLRDGLLSTESLKRLAGYMADKPRSNVTPVSDKGMAVLFSPTRIQADILKGKGTGFDKGDIAALRYNLRNAEESYRGAYSTAGMRQSDFKSLASGIQQPASIFRDNMGFRPKVKPLSEGYSKVLIGKQVTPWASQAASYSSGWNQINISRIPGYRPDMRHEIGHWVESILKPEARAALMRRVLSPLNSKLNTELSPTHIAEALGHYLAAAKGRGGAIVRNATAKGWESAQAGLFKNPALKSVVEHLQRNYNFPGGKLLGH